MSNTMLAVWASFGALGFAGIDWVIEGPMSMLIISPIVGMVLMAIGLTTVLNRPKPVEVRARRHEP